MIKESHNHEFEAHYTKDSIVLILGSFPSVVSRKRGFYYMHPQNRFWHVLSEIFEPGFSDTDIDTKKRLLDKYKIALYDVVSSCQIKGSNDSTLTAVVPSDISSILEETNIKVIILNGKKARDLFQKHFPKLNNIAYALPSTSSQNAKYNRDDLVKSWKILKTFIHTNE
jgi:hypoxanthine-DNA glycosylase